MSIRAVVVLAAIIAAIIAVGIAFLAMKIQRGEREDAKLASLFVADPNNQTTLGVCGWTRTGLQKFIGDFLPMYGIADSGVQIETKDEHSFEIRFPSDIQPKLLLFLVNYLQYPKGFDLTHRAIGVVAHVVLTRAFGASDPKLIGKRAAIYVPANDNDYDVVYVKIESGETYRVPFSDMDWASTDDPRVPAANAGL